MKKKRQKAQSSKLQFPSNAIISNTHAQEDRNRPVPQLASDHEDGDLWLVFAGQVELKEQRGHA